MRTIYKHILVLFVATLFFITQPNNLAQALDPVEPGSRVFGQDWLGLQHRDWPLKISLQTLPPNSAIGVLHGSFGHSMKNIVTVLESEKVVALRAHLVNGSCIRGQRCDRARREFGVGYSATSFNNAILKRNKTILNEVRRRAQIYEALAQKYPSKRVYVSPVLEHNLSLKAFSILADVVKQAAPNVTVVNNPMNARLFRTQTKWVLESHDPNFVFRVGRCISSPDGLNSTDTNTKKYYDLTKRCEFVLNWVGRFNGRVGDNLDANGNFIMPFDRKHFPEKRHFLDINGLVNYYRFSTSKPEGIRPPGCFVIKPISEPLLWKTWADDKGNGDRRAARPLFMSTSRTESVNVIDYTGNKIATLTYWGTYPPGNDGKIRHRYYMGHRGGSGLTPSELTSKLEKTSGIEWGWIKQGSTCYGPFVPMYRIGFFRKIELG